MYAIVKNPFNFYQPFILSLKVYVTMLKVLQTSTDPCRQFAVPFKADYF
jgi:hypothetical protein